MRQISTLQLKRNARIGYKNYDVHIYENIEKVNKSLLIDEPILK
jgi:hypothetical protein